MLETAGCRGWGAVSAGQKATSTQTSPWHFEIKVTRRPAAILHKGMNATRGEGTCVSHV